MNLQEYQSKAILREHGIRVPAGQVAETPEEAASAAERIGGERWMVKAQILAGGRAEGKFKGQELKSGVRNVTNLVNVGTESRSMLGRNLITPQTGPDGLPVSRVYVEQALQVDAEIALMLVVDEFTQAMVLLLSANGGSGIESLVRDDPDAVMRVPVSIEHGVDAEGLEAALARIDLQNAAAGSLRELVDRMIAIAREMDLTLLEINPAGLVGGEYVALDAKMVADDNALYRQPALVDLDAQDDAAGSRRRASRDGFNYIRMQGDIACMTVGAGLSMATLDTLVQFGGRPANFLDLPPDSKVNRVTSALELLLGSAGVRCLLINVFGGGIMRCDTVSDAIQIVNRVHPFRIPLVVRLAGTNAELANRRLREGMPGLALVPNLAEAARLSVELARSGMSADPGKPEGWLKKMIQRAGVSPGEGRE